MARPFDANIASKRRAGQELHICKLHKCLCSDMLAAVALLSAAVLAIDAGNMSRRNYRLRGDIPEEY